MPFFKNPANLEYVINNYWKHVQPRTAGCSLFCPFVPSSFQITNHTTWGLFKLLGWSDLFILRSFFLKVKHKPDMSTEHHELLHFVHLSFNSPHSAPPHISFPRFFCSRLHCEAALVQCVLSLPLHHPFNLIGKIYNNKSVDVKSNLENTD